MSESKDGWGCWYFAVYREDRLIDAVSASDHKMTNDGAKSFLRALVARYSEKRAAELLPMFVNRRRGSLERDERWTPESYFLHDLQHYGYKCGDVDLLGVAYHRLSLDEANAIEALRQQNIRSRSP